MPFYQYVCEFCEKEYEIFHMIAENVTGDICDNCEKGELVRLLSNFDTGHFNNRHLVKSGDIVKDFIKTSTKELSDEKERLRRIRND